MPAYSRASPSEFRAARLVAKAHLAHATPAHCSGEDEKELRFGFAGAQGGSSWNLLRWQSPASCAVLFPCQVQAFFKKKLFMLSLIILSGSNEFLPPGFIETMLTF